MVRSIVPCTAVNPSSTRWFKHIVALLRASLLLVGSYIVLGAAWIAIVRYAQIDSVAAGFVSGLLAVLLSILVVQYGYPDKPTGARSLVARGLATLVFGVGLGTLVTGSARRLSESNRPFVVVGIGIVFTALGLWSRRTTSSKLRIGQDPRGASAFVAPLLILASAGIITFAKPTTINVVWHSIRTAQTPAAQGIGLLFGACLIPFVVSCFVTLRQNRDSGRPIFIAAFPAIGSALIGAFSQSSPVLYPPSSRVEEHAASLASEWWHSSQTTAAGFYLSTLFLLIAGAVCALDACRTGLRDEPSRRQTIVALLGPTLIVALTCAWLHYAKYPIGRLLQTDAILPSAAITVASLAMIHIAAGVKVPEKSIILTCLAASLAVLSFAVAQALPAGSNADALQLAPFEWVAAAANIREKQLSVFVPAASYAAPLLLIIAFATRGLWNGWKNILITMAPGFLMVAAGTIIALGHTRHAQNELVIAFRRHIPSDVTLPSGPLGSLTSCVDLALEKILFVGRDHITLNGQTIASTNQLDSPTTCAEIVQRVNTTVPRLAFDENVSFSQTTCLLNAFALREPRICRVMFMGRCKAGTRVDNDEMPACNEQMQANVPLCVEQALDVDGCPSADYFDPFIVLTPTEFITARESERASDPWPASPVRDDGVWKHFEVPHYHATIAVTNNTTMGGFVAFALQAQGLPFRLRPMTTAATELPKAPDVVHPLGVRVNPYIATGSDMTNDALRQILDGRKDELRLCVEPAQLPWLFDVGIVHLLFGRDGKPVGVWPSRHANAQFGGCIAKVLSNIQMPPQQQPLLTEIDVRLAANMPNIIYRSDWQPRPEKKFPKDSVMRDELSYMIFHRVQAFERQIKPRTSIAQCLVPALMRDKTLHGTVTFDITGDEKNTQVSAHSDEIEKDTVECLGKMIQRHASEALQTTFRYWTLPPNEKQYLPIEFMWQMEIKAPESTETTRGPGASQ